MAIVGERTDAARDMAVLVYEAVGVISQGPAGVERGLNTLKLGIERLFQFAETRELSLRLFLYELEGLLSHDDLPAELIGGAIERADVAEAGFIARTRRKQAMETLADSGSGKPKNRKREELKGSARCGPARSGTTSKRSEANKHKR